MSKSNRIIELLMLLISCINLSLAKLPKTITPCHRDDPELGNCIIREVYNVRPLLGKGDFGDGFKTPPLEPLYLDSIVMNRGRQFNAVFSDLVAYGGSNFTIEKIKANATAMAFDLLITLPRIEFTGQYFMKLDILVLRTESKGNMTGKVDNCKASVKMRGQRYMGENGREYVRMNKMPLRLDVGDRLKLKMNNLFNGDRTLGQVGNAIINANPYLYLSEVVPGLEKGLEEKFLEVANQILKTATFDEMFPLRENSMELPEA